MTNEPQMDDWVAIRDITLSKKVEVYHELVDPRRVGIDSLTLCNRTLDVATRREYVLGEVRPCSVCERKRGHNGRPNPSIPQK